jgi:hypothetical protein
VRVDAGDLLAGRFRLEARLGGGGMGEVWRARDEVLGRAVAVKVVTQAVAGDPELLARFRREATAAAGLQHPGIAVVHHSGTHEGAPFIVMELLAGPSLAEVLAAHPGGLPPGEAAGLAAQVASALAYAHGKGIVHRDIKPANLVRAADGSVKVCDFGLARLTDRADGAGAVTQLTRVGTVLGTPPYMAPEQWRGEPADARTDLYALGATLHALLTGTPPFPGPTIEAFRHQHLNAPPPRLDALRPGMPAALGDLLQRLLAKDPASRPATAAEVSDALSAARLQHPPEAQPSGTTTVAATDRERARNIPSRPIKVCFWTVGPIVGLMGALAPYARVHPVQGFHVSVLFDGIIWGCVAGGLAAFIGLLGVYFSAKQHKSDIFTFDAEKLTITRWTPKAGELQSPRPLAVRWQALERVAIESEERYSYTLIAWFLPDRQPSAGWAQERWAPRRQDGGYVIYDSSGATSRSGGSDGRGRALEPAPAPVERLHETLLKYAGPLYQDPGHVPPVRAASASTQER